MWFCCLFKKFSALLHLDQFGEAGSADQRHMLGKRPGEHLEDGLTRQWFWIDQRDRNRRRQMGRPHLIDLTARVARFREIPTSPLPIANRGVSSSSDA